MTAPLKPVSKTAYYCCGVRALDARADNSICGDTLADRFMTAEAWQLFEPFRRFTEPNVANAVRHRIIDDLLRERLSARPERLVILLGAGFDTRPCRLTGGRWVELDAPEVMALKERQLPAARARNPLTRIPIDFEPGTLAGSLAPWAAEEHPIVVLEGVLPYLTPEEIGTLAATLRRVLRGPSLICDLMTPQFVHRYSGTMREALGGLGARFAVHARDPGAVIEEAGYRLASRESIAERAVALGVFQIPRLLLATVFRVLRKGYSIATFESLPKEEP